MITGNKSALPKSGWLVAKVIIANINMRNFTNII
jgi:hypothetical protein